MAAGFNLVKENKNLNANRERSQTIYLRCQYGRAYERGKGTKGTYKNTTTS
jgi:hypothetical protein